MLSVLHMYANEVIFLRVRLIVVSGAERDLPAFVLYQDPGYDLHNVVYV